jgi:hypothetical protein
MIDAQLPTHDSLAYSPRRECYAGDERRPMSELDREKLYAFLCGKAKMQLPVTRKEVADHFGVSEGAAAKCLSLLTGNRVLLETGSNQFECARVPTLTLIEFESAASQGKTNTAYVDGLWNMIARLKRDNETMRKKLLDALALVEKQSTDNREP